MKTLKDFFRKIRLKRTERRLRAAEGRWEQLYSQQCPFNRQAMASLAETISDLRKRLSTLGGSAI